MYVRFVQSSSQATRQMTVHEAAATCSPVLLAEISSGFKVKGLRSLGLRGPKSVSLPTRFGVDHMMAGLHLESKGPSGTITLIIRATHDCKSLYRRTVPYTVSSITLDL